MCIRDRTNSQPDSNLPLQQDDILNIIAQPVLSDGLVDDYQVMVSYQTDPGTSVAYNPDFFNDLVAPSVNSNQKYVFFQQVVDFDNLERYVLVEDGIVNSDYATLGAIELVKHEYVTGQIFYAYQSGVFYQLTLTLQNQLVVNSITGWQAQVGRQGLYFQYRHNAPLTNRIDPGSTNIIDVYLVTQDYYTSYTPVSYTHLTLPTNREV